MSITSIPPKVKFRLWGKAAGRCQYDGCNQPLWMDSLTKAEFNTSYIAHIIADQPAGPRGDEILSEKLNADISNLMLMCDVHHRLIDQEDISGHTVERLQEMKRKHESRMEVLTSMTEDLQSHVLLYGANIGMNGAPVSMDRAKEAMYPNRYPAERTGFELGWKNSSFYDYEDNYWVLEQKNLKRHFESKVRLRLNDDIKHLSVFGLAPQPLLIELGRLVSDILPTDVYQLHREPSTWMWQEHPNEFEYLIYPPGKISKKIALNLSLSATIDNSRIYQVLGDEISIWTMTIPTPNNDFLKSKEQLGMFREKFRLLMDEIKRTHGYHSKVNLFPAVPVSIAIEIGRVWMPKADLPFSVYDENRARDGFIYALEISQDSIKDRIGS